MRIKKFLCAALAIAGLMMSAQVKAAGTTIWNGVNVTSARNQAILLYNVGTGKLLIHGGDWGTQARLFYQNWGEKLTLEYASNAYKVKTPFDKYLTVNVPSVTSAKTSWTDPAEVWQPIMDGSGSYSGSTTGTYSTNLTFTRVEASSNTETYTYYISQTPKSGGNTYYIGAAYGMSSATEFMTDLGDDECAYTTETYAKSTDTYQIGASTMVSAQKLYQWRIILFSAYEAYVTSAADELNANISYDIIDQDFTRDVHSFYNNWTAMETAATSSATPQTNGRFAYTWGFNAQGTRQRHRDWYGTREASDENLRVSGEKWCKPIRLKEQFSDDWVWSNALYGCTSESQLNNLTDDQKAQVSRGQMKDAKYGFMSFEGVGAVYSSITAPATGWYQVSCIGFSQSTTANRGYLYAAAATSPVDPSNLDYTNDAYAKDFLKNVAAGTYDRTSYMECMGDNTLNTNLSKVGAGYVLTRNQDDFRTTVLIHATVGQTIYFGVGKDAGTRTQGDGNYYYDADWVPTDNYQIVFLGESVVVFDEEETSLDYLKSNGQDKTYNNTTARLKRTFAKNSWNSFVFPIDLTSRQIKEAFGEGAGLAELVSIGSLSGLADCIDFKSVQLPADNNAVAIEAGKFYIIKPTADPAEIEGEKYYILGTHTFSTSGMNQNGGWVLTNPVTSENYYSVDTEKTQGSPSYDQYKDNQIKWFATYVSSGTNKSVPTGSYVLGNNDGSIDTPTTMYHLTKDTKILGFRGWIRDKADIEGSGSSAKDLRIFVTNDYEGETTGINELPLTVQSHNNVIYDVSGRQVGIISGDTFTMPRAKGMYIVNGKKFIVK